MLKLTWLGSASIYLACMQQGGGGAVTVTIAFDNAETAGHAWHRGEVMMSWCECRTCNLRHLDLRYGVRQQLARLGRAQVERKGLSARKM